MLHACPLLTPLLNIHSSLFFRSRSGSRTVAPSGSASIPTTWRSWPSSTTSGWGYCPPTPSPTPRGAGRPPNPPTPPSLCSDPLQGGWGACGTPSPPPSQPSDSTHRSGPDPPCQECDFVFVIINHLFSIYYTVFQMRLLQ